VKDLRGYRFLPHTADIKVEAWGETLEEAYEASGIAFYNIILDVDNVEKRIEHPITADGFDPESLLFNYIEELIVKFELERLVFRDFKLYIERGEDSYRLHGTGYGERYNREKHGYKVQVKAITYHEMEINEKEDKVLIRYVVDI
jgi:SHS2 domain-containing protein